MTGVLSWNPTPDQTGMHYFESRCIATTAPATDHVRLEPADQLVLNQQIATDLVTRSDGFSMALALTFTKALRKFRLRRRIRPAHSRSRPASRSSISIRASDAIRSSPFFIAAGLHFMPILRDLL